MRVGNRLFPYPVLNKNEELTDYVSDCSFMLSFATADDGRPIIEDNELVLKDACFTLRCDSLDALIQSKQADVALIVECSDTVFRKSFPITKSASDILIPAPNLSGQVSVSCYLYAKDCVMLPESDSYLDEYSGMSFEVEKYDLLAVDDGFSFRVDLDEDEDNQAASIFSVVKVEREDSLMQYRNTEQRIIITLPDEYYSAYENISMHSRFNNIAFSMLAIPALCGCLSEVQNNGYEDISEIIETKQWFRSVAAAYERETGAPLDDESFRTANPLELSQMVLNCAACKGLHDFEDVLLNAYGIEEDDGQD